MNKWNVWAHHIGPKALNIHLLGLGLQGLLVGNDGLDNVDIEVADQSEWKEEVASHQEHEVALPGEVVGQEVEGACVQKTL